MKISLTLILVGLVAVTANANERYKKGDTLYVWAADGINIRIQPDGEVISKLEYGTAVVANQDDQRDSSPKLVIPSQKINGKEYPGVSIYGKFVEVKVNNVTGFVFDAYLSKLSPIKIINNNGEFERYEEYFSRVFGVLKELKKDLQPDNIDLKVLYNNGISYELQTTACCGSQTIIFPDMTMTEAYVFLNRIYNFEQHMKNARESKSYYFKVIENIDKGYEQYMQFDFELISIRIWRFNNYVMINRGGGD